MLENYTIINEVDDKTLDLFDYYWDKYSDTLPALPSILHKGMDQKAAILNIWLLSTNRQSFKTLKYDRMFSHSFVYRLHQTMMFYLPSDSPLHLFPNRCEYLFLYSYYLVSEILTYLEEIFEENPNLLVYLNGLEYFKLTDTNINDDDSVHKLLKQLNIKAFNPLERSTVYLKMHEKVTDLLNKQYDIRSLLLYEEHTLPIN